MKNKAQEQEDVDDDYLNIILKQYKVREDQLNSNYHIHPHYNCKFSCSLCYVRMSDNTMKKEIQLDFFESSQLDESQSDTSEIHEQDESILNQFRTLNKLISFNDLNKRKQPDLQDKQKSNKIKIKDPMDFLSLCMKTQQPSKTGKCLNIKVMDSLFFFQREPCLFIYNDKDKGLKLQKEKQILTNLLEMRNVFIKRRFQYDMEVRTNTEKRLNESFNQMEFDQKSAEIIQRIKKEVQKIQISTKEFALVFFRNGGVQIMTQLDIMLLLDKRKIDPVWDQIVLIQAFPMDFKGILTKRSTDGQQSYCALDERYKKIKYMKDNIQYEELFDKALEYVGSVNNSSYGSPIYVKEYDKYIKFLKTQDKIMFLTFLVYQIVHFFDAYHKQKIKCIRVDFVEDDFGEFFIINCSQLRFYNINKIQWNEQILREFQIISEQKREEVDQELNQKQTLRNLEQIKLGNFSEIPQNFKSQRHQDLFASMSENTKYFREKYLSKIDEAERELVDIGNIEKSNGIFKQLNSKSTQLFSNLIDDNAQLNQKHELLLNFGVDHKRFTRHMFQLKDVEVSKQQKELYKQSLKDKNLNSLSQFKPQTTSNYQGRQAKTTQAGGGLLNTFINLNNNKTPKQYVNHKITLELVKTNQLGRKFKSMNNLIVKQEESQARDYTGNYFSKQKILPNLRMLQVLSMEKY